MNGLGQFVWKSIAEKVEVENMETHDVNYPIIDSSSPCATTNYPVLRDCLVGMAQRCPITYRALADLGI